MAPPDKALLERVLVLTPSGNDAENVLYVLRNVGLTGTRCEDVLDMSGKFLEGAGVLLIAEEGLGPEGIGALCAALTVQPKWSDISLLILTRATETDQTGQRLLRFFGPHGNVVLVERPLRPIALVSAVQVALRARQRQYDLREFIEERERTLHALAESEEKNRLIMENVKDFAMFAFDLQGKVTSWNSGAEQMLGYSTEEALGGSVDRFFTEEDRAEDVPGWERRVASEKGLAPNERWHLRKGGELFFGSGATRPLLDEKRKQHGFIKVMRDVTQRKKAQKALEEKTRRLELLAEVARNLLSLDSTEEIAREIFGCLSRELKLDIYFYFEVDASGGNLRLASYGGLSEEEAGGLSKINFQDAGSLSGTEPRVVWTDEGLHNSMERQAEFLRRVGVRSSASFPLRRDDGVIGTLSFGARNREGFGKEDIEYLQTVCNFVALAQERAMYQRDLEKTVQQRTAELQTKVGELEAFSYSVSHDLRAPLRAMQGYSHVLLEDHSEGLDAGAKEYLRRIANSAERLDRLVSDILTYSRVARGDIEMSVIELEGVIGAVIQAYPQLQNADIEIKGPLSRVLGHEGSLIQCVSNLLGNAIKFVPETRMVRVEIWAENRNGRVRVNFQDNGIGISPRDQERIFRIFEKGSQTRSSEGTGIGLAIVRKAVERMDGTTGVHSTPGEGSRFWIELPAAQ